MVIIRPMYVQDIDSVKACNKRNLPENYQYIFLMYVIVAAQGACFVAENTKGEVIGYIITKGVDALEEREVQDKNTSGYIVSIAVDALYRGRGIGKMLMCTGLHGLSVLLQRKGAKIKEYTVYLNVRQSNTAAIKMYKEVFGFSVQKIEEDYYPDKEKALLMHKVFLA